MDHKGDWVEQAMEAHKIELVYTIFLTELRGNGVRRNEGLRPCCKS